MCLAGCWGLVLPGRTSQLADFRWSFPGLLCVLSLQDRCHPHKGSVPIYPVPKVGARLGDVGDHGQMIIPGEEAASLAPQLCCHLPGGLASPHGVSVPNRSLGRQSQATGLLYRSKVAFLAQQLAGCARCTFT